MIDNFSIHTLEIGVGCFANVSADVELHLRDSCLTQLEIHEQNEL